MSKHTQGPWEAKRFNDGVCEIFDKTTTRQGCGLASVNTLYDEEAKANAALIAAAPDLLDACFCVIGAFTGDPTFEKTNAALKACKSAIAKAQGRA